jgi:hypothetical protein
MVHSNRLRHVQMSNPLGLLDSLDNLGKPCPLSNWSNLDKFGQFGHVSQPKDERDERWQIGRFVPSPNHRPALSQAPQINRPAAGCSGTRL